MHFKKILFVISFSYLLLLVGCDPSESVPSGTYDVESDCEDAKSSGTLEIENNSIFGPSNKKGTYEIEGATEFGFPSDTWEVRGKHLLESVKGDVTCKTVIFKQTTEFAFFVCERGDTMLCSIFVERQ